MSIAVGAYECPLCNSLYLEKNQAVECAQECLSWEMYGQEKAYACGRCGKIFGREVDANLHEQACIVTLKDLFPGEDWRSCAQCNNCDAEGLRYRPCPQAHHAPMRKACDSFELATK